MTFQEIVDEVLANLIDSPTYIQSVAPTLVNRAIRSAMERRNFYVMKRTLGPLVTNNIGTHDFNPILNTPSDFKQFADKAYVQYFLGDIRWVNISPTLEDARAAFGENPTIDIGMPMVLVRTEASDDAGATVLQYYPFSDNASDWPDGQYRVYVPYFRYLPDLSGIQTNWFTENGSEYLVNKATALGFRKLWGDNRKTGWEQDAAECWRDLVKNDTALWMGGIEYLVPHLDVNEARLNN